jgi:hypothetical protein
VYHCKSPLYLPRRGRKWRRLMGRPIVFLK